VKALPPRAFRICGWFVGPKGSGRSPGPGRQGRRKIESKGEGLTLPSGVAKWFARGGVWPRIRLGIRVRGRGGIEVKSGLECRNFWVNWEFSNQQLVMAQFSTRPVGAQVSRRRAPDVADVRRPWFNRAARIIPGRGGCGQRRGRSQTLPELPAKSGFKGLLPPSLRTALSQKRKPKLQELSTFTQQLSNLLHSGMPLTVALEQHDAPGVQGYFGRT